MDLTKMTLEQLKSLAYEQIKLFEETRRNLQILDAEILKKEEVKEVKEEPTKKQYEHKTIKEVQ